MPKLPSSSAFQQIVAACLQQASINEEILRQRPESVEAIHGMRIAIRRLRAALSLFAEMIEGDDLGALKQELKWMSDLLGAARDLDVLVAGPVRSVRLRHPDLEGLEELGDKSEELRQAAHRGLNEAIYSERFRRLLLGIVEFAQAGAWSRDASPERRKLRSVTIVAFAPEELDRRLRSICKKKSRVAIVGENELDRHRVRIKAKKLRYIAEFLKSLARTRDYEKTSVALKKLQSTLGDVHDAVAAEQIVSRILEKENSAELAFAASILRGEFAAPASSIEKASAAHAELRVRRRSGRGCSCAFSFVMQGLDPSIQGQLPRDNTKPSPECPARGQLEAGHDGERWFRRPSVIARSPCDEAIQGPRTVAPGLLRCARNDGGVDAAIIGRRLSALTSLKIGVTRLKLR